MINLYILWVVSRKLNQSSQREYFQSVTLSNGLFCCEVLNFAKINWLQTRPLAWSAWRPDLMSVPPNQKPAGATGVRFVIWRLTTWKWIFYIVSWETLNALSACNYCPALVRKNKSWKICEPLYNVSISLPSLKIIFSLIYIRHFAKIGVFALIFLWSKGIA